MELLQYCLIYISNRRRRYTIAQANAQLNEKGAFTGELIPVRKDGEIGLARPDDIELMDVSPKQLVSVASAMIPFWKMMMLIER